MNYKKNYYDYINYVKTLNRSEHHMSEEHKNKLRMINIGRHPSEETRRKMSVSGKGRIFTYSDSWFYRNALV